MMYFFTWVASEKITHSWGLTDTILYAAERRQMCTLGSYTLVVVAHHMDHPM
jgi:hypothetical protein